MTNYCDKKPEKIMHITQPSLPEIEDFIPYLWQIRESKVLINNGSFHREFEMKLTEYLGVVYISLFANGTLKLLIINYISDYSK